MKATIFRRNRQLSLFTHLRGREQFAAMHRNLLSRASLETLTIPQAGEHLQSREFLDAHLNETRRFRMFTL